MSLMKNNFSLINAYKSSTSIKNICSLNFLFLLTIIILQTIKSLAHKTKHKLHRQSKVFALQTSSFLRVLLTKLSASDIAYQKCFVWFAKIFSFGDKNSKEKHSRSHSKRKMLKSKKISSRKKISHGNIKILTTIEKFSTKSK